MGNRLGIGLADEFAAALGQLLAQLAEILDDAVVNDRNRVGRMRMGIVFGRPAMRRPARVSDAGIPAERLTLEPSFQRAQFAFGATASKYPMIECGNAGGIVTPIFKPLERIDQLPGNRLASQNSDDSAHPPGWPLCPLIEV